MLLLVGWDVRVRSELRLVVLIHLRKQLEEYGFTVAHELLTEVLLEVVRDVL